MSRSFRPPIRRLERVGAATAWLLCLWELPQTLVGAALYLVLRASGAILAVERYGRRYLVRTRAMGVSLGFFVFWFAGSRIRDHELGHALQSLWLGPLYLLAVGLPSVSRAAYASLYAAKNGRAWTGYFDAYPRPPSSPGRVGGGPESWADRLGGIGGAHPLDSRGSQSENPPAGSMPPSSPGRGESGGGPRPPSSPGRGESGGG